MSLLLRLSLYFHLLIDLLYRRLHRRDKESSFSDPLPTNLASIPEHFRPYAIDRRDSPRLPSLTKDSRRAYAESPTLSFAAALHLWSSYRSGIERSSGRGIS